MFLLWNKLKASVYLLRLIKIKWLKCLSSLGNNFLLSLLPWKQENQISCKASPESPQVPFFSWLNTLYKHLCAWDRAEGVKGRQAISQFVNSVFLKVHLESHTAKTWAKHSKSSCSFILKPCVRITCEEVMFSGTTIKNKPCNNSCK